MTGSRTRGREREAREKGRPGTPTGARWKLLVVSHVHWDREWYYPFEAYRIRLVGFMDELLDLLDAEPEFRSFMLDGHSVLLKDYLEVRPGRRADIERHVRGGRLLVGPWYVIPDEFLPGGESLVRNLQLGLRLARQCGPPMMVGYLPDPFGHIAHMPAVLSGFGIEDAAMWRGTDADLEKTEFLWQAPDGSQVLTLHMVQGYHIADGLPSDREELSARLAAIRGELEPRAGTPYLLLMNGFDHTPPQKDLPTVLAAAREMLDAVEVVHSSLPEAFESVRQSLGDGADSLPSHAGEFRSSRRSFLLPGVLSTRMWIKQRNRECEDLLTHWAEPFSAWVSLLRQRLGPAWREPPLPLGPRSPYPTEPAAVSGLLDLAWETLLQNHAHDSICGCGVDQIHDEMRVRFDRCQQIGEEITRYSLRALAYLMPPYGGRGVAVYNPVSGPRTDLVSATVAWQDGTAPVAVVDEAGLRTPCQVLEPPAGGLPWGTVGFMAGGVPGYGYKAFRLEYGQAEPAGAPGGGAAAMENEYFRVSADAPDGTIALLDKASGRELRGLNRFVDGGDRGDEYNYCRPAQDEVIDRPCRPPQIAVVESGPARWTLEVSLEYSLPRALSGDRDLRSPERAACAIRSRVSLCAGVRRVEFRTEVENQAEDHRLRVHFPTDVETDISYAEQHFGVVARPVAPPPFDGTWAEEPVATHPQKTFVDVSDGERGLLLANRGLPEYEVLPPSPGDPGVTVALTLLRCVGWLSRADLTSRRALAGPPLAVPGAQCRGRHVFEYALVPHEGDWEAAFLEAHRFATPLRGRRLDEGSGALPPSASLIDITPSTLVLSALRMEADGRGAVARLYNIGSRPVEGQVRVPEGCGRAELVNMDGAFLGEVPLKDGWVTIRAKANEIVNLRFVTTGQVRG